MDRTATCTTTTEFREDMKPSVIAFSGSIASGKSTLSLALAGELHWKYASFGDYVRLQAKRCGLTPSRKVLQDIGQSLIEEGWEQFCRLVLIQAQWSAGEPLIVDGIRHLEAIATLRSLVAPLELWLIYISVDEITQKTRLQQRNRSAEESEQSVQNHSTEIQVKTRLQQIADLIVDGSQPVPHSIYDIVSWLHHMGY